MNFLFLNLPFEKRLMRRYICSYYAPNFLFPPQELLYLATIQKNKKRGEIYLFDSIGENAGYDKVRGLIKENNIECLVSLTGFESIEYELDFLNRLKKEFNSLKIIIFGHYPTIFYNDILLNTGVDIILLNEPDITFSELSDALHDNRDIENIRGLSYKKNNQVYCSGSRERIKDLDSLPIPDHSLLNIKLYSEPFFPRPFTAIQTSRGCPFGCNYCVRTYGREYRTRTPENIFKEISYLHDELKVKHFRIIDDTFTINRKNVIELANRIIESGIKVKWTALSRVDALDEELLGYLERSGCKRLFIGFESGSQKILDLYGKGYNLSKSMPGLKGLLKSKIEIAGFFMVGLPEETLEDLNKSIELAKKLDLDYVGVAKLLYYPGTRLFDLHRDKLEFRLFPHYHYSNKHIIDEQKYVEWEKYFYKKFYLRPAYFRKWIAKFFGNPIEFLKSSYTLFRYIYLDKQDEERKDLF